MPNKTFSSAVAVLALGVSSLLPAQSSREREAERVGERIGRIVERSVEQALRAAEQSLSELDALGLDRRSGRALQQGGTSLDTTFAFSKDGVVDLRSHSGDIIVSAWSRPQARVRASSERGRLRWDLSASRITIEPEMGRNRGRDERIEVSVPQGVRVVAHTGSGDITVRDVNGAIEAHSTSGDVEVVGAGRVELTTLSGDVQATRIRGDVEATAVAGSVELDDVEARRVEVDATSGDIVLTNVRSREITAATVNGDVSFSGTVAADGRYEFTSHAGTVALTVPASVSARFAIETYNGELESDFPVTLRPTTGQRRQPGGRIEFTLGSGDARIFTTTFSGNIEIRRDTRR